MHRGLLIGATGVFGQRLAVGLANMEGLKLVVASRRLDRAQSLAMSLEGPAEVDAVALDHRHDLEPVLQRLKPWLVIDASGPFQGAGYRLPLAAIEVGAHVVDLADARDYLMGYTAALDAPAREAGVAALAGASSTPALSAAAVRELVGGWQRLDRLRMAITPGGRSDVGRAVVSAVLSYAGRPVTVWSEGRMQTTPGWCGGRFLDMPGLGRRRVAPVETSDADLLASRHAVTSRVEFEAGLESSLEQYGLEFLAALRRVGLLSNLDPLSSWLLAARKITRLTTGDRGGMLVEATGLDEQGQLVTRRWSLLAQRGDGLFVPTLPAIAAVRALLQGRIDPGARIAGDALSLADIEAEMAPHAITTRQDVRVFKHSVFDEALGSQSMGRLPLAVRLFHGLSGAPVWCGSADIETGGGLPGRIIRRLMGMPEAGTGIPVTVSVARVIGEGPGGSEIWTRNFGGRRFSSRLETHRAGTVTETFGALSFKLEVTVNDGSLELPVSAWRLFGIPMPRFLGPGSQAREFEDDRGSFRFDVRLSLPIIGMLIHYRGYLEPKAGPLDDHRVCDADAKATKD